MEEDCYKQTDDKQIISTPRAEDPIPGTFQVVDRNFQTTDETESAYGARGYREETAAEFTPNRVNNTFNGAQNRTDGASFGGATIGVISLILSILSLFMMPFLFGILGIIGGFISRARGAKSLGTWAIGIGAISIVVGIFILPFF